MTDFCLLPRGRQITGALLSVRQENQEILTTAHSQLYVFFVAFYDHSRTNCMYKCKWLVSCLRNTNQPIMVAVPK